MKYKSEILSIIWCIVLYNRNMFLLSSITKIYLNNNDTSIEERLFFCFETFNIFFWEFLIFSKYYIIHNSISKITLTLCKKLNRILINLTFYFAFVWLTIFCITRNIGKLLNHLISRNARNMILSNSERRQFVLWLLS